MAGEGMLPGGSETLTDFPGVGGYAEIALAYFDEVETRGATRAKTVRDRAGGRDDEARGALLDGVDGLLVVMTAEDQLGSQRRKGPQCLLRVGEPVAAGGLALYGVVVDHDHPGGIWSGT